jgi:outer membrane biogenesis lipoprotein LolB
MNRAAAAIFLALLCSACPKRMDYGPQGPITDPEQLFQLTRAAQDTAASLQGDGKLRIQSPQGSGSVSAFLAASRPGLLRVEMFDFFNRPVAVLVTDGQRFGLLQAQENKYYQGPATPRNLSRFLPVALPSEELVSVMLGRVPFIPAERMTLAVDEKHGVYVLTLIRGAISQVLHIHPRHLRVVRSEVKGMPAYGLEYDGFKPEGEGQGAVLFAHDVTLRAQQADTSLSLRYTDIQLNESLDLTLFDLAAPEGVPVVDVDEGGQALPPVALPPATPGS